MVSSAFHDMPSYSGQRATKPVPDAAQRARNKPLQQWEASVYAAQCAPPNSKLCSITTGVLRAGAVSALLRPERAVQDRRPQADALPTAMLKTEDMPAAHLDVQTARHGGRQVAPCCVSEHVTVGSIDGGQGMRVVNRARGH